MSILKIILYLNICISAVLANASDIQFPNGNNVNEGDTLEYLYTASSTRTNCQLIHPVSPSTADAADYSLTLTDSGGNIVPEPFTLTPSTTYTATVIANANDNLDEILVVNLQCGTLSPCPATINILAAGGQGDPHFKQLVTDITTGEKKQICYDVTGQSGQYLHIFSEKSTHLAVTAQLLDDYYMHKIFVSYPHKNFTFTESGLMFNGVQTMLWNDEDKEKIDFDFITITKSPNSFRIVNKNDEKHVVEVLRKSNSFNVRHLDVMISGLGDINADLGGLMGSVNNNLFEFKEQVQDSSRVQFNVRNNRRFGRIMKRNNNECILIDLKDAIFPYNNKQFITY